MNDLVVGIDLGTTNSELAVVRNDQLEVVPIHGQAIMPSCVGLDPAGNLIVGRAAQNQILATPDRTLVSVKRRMGEDVKLPLGDREYSPEEISSFILRELKLEGERHLGHPIRRAVITVPAFFNERQRRATQVAGELAGLEVPRILHEPTAAALAYGSGIQEGETTLVYDLGGGTFDVSVVVVEQGIVEVKASHGDTHLGGDDFDQLLVARAVLEFKRRHNVDLMGDSAVLRRLRFIMERAKRVLSDEPFVLVREEYLDGKNHLEFELLRHEYEEMIIPLVEKTLTCVHQSLADARLTPDAVHKIMLVGGATRTPLVQNILHERLKLEPRFEINPDLIVAMGAAVQGGVIGGQKRHSILVDITPHSFQTTVLSDQRGYDDLVCLPVIPRNTPLPASKSEMVSTVDDEQEQAIIQVYQGESEDPDENLHLGEFYVEGLSKVPAGNPVIIHFDLDLNGLLKVTATEKATGLAKSVTLDTKAKSSLDLDQARQNIADLVGAATPADAPPRDSGKEARKDGNDGDGDDDDDDNEVALPPAADSADDSQQLLRTARDLRKRGEALLERNISPDDANEVRDLVHRSATAIKEGRTADLADLNAKLSDLLFYLED